MMFVERKSDVGPIRRTARSILRAHGGHPAQATCDVTDNSSEPDAAVTDASAEDTKGVASYGNPASARRLAKVIAAANAQSASIIGITGARAGVGVSLTSRELSGALSTFGTKTLLVNLSRAEIVDASSKSTIAKASFLSLAAEVSPSLKVFDTDAEQPLALTADELRTNLSKAVRAGFTVVLDLPPVMQASGAPTPSIAATGPFYDLAFLVCLSGEMDQTELEACLETCRIVGLKLGGLILNDWRMPASTLIGS